MKHYPGKQEFFSSFYDKNPRQWCNTLLQKGCIILPQLREKLKLSCSATKSSAGVALEENLRNPPCDKARKPKADVTRSPSHSSLIFFHKNVWGKVVFSQVSACPGGGGVCDRRGAFVAGGCVHGRACRACMCGMGVWPVGQRVACVQEIWAVHILLEYILVAKYSCCYSSNMKTLGLLYFLVIALTSITVSAGTANYTVQDLDNKPEVS